MMKIVNMFDASPSGGLPYASARKRLKAFFFDYAIIFGFVMVLAGVNYGLILSRGVLEDVSHLYASPWAKDGLAFLTLILPIILYFTYMESSSRQASLGKQKFGLMVVASNGAPLAIRQAFVRNLFKFLPWQIAHTSIFHIQGWPSTPETPAPLVQIGFVLVWVMVAAYLVSLFFTRSHRTPYDWAAGACVVDSA